MGNVKDYLYMLMVFKRNEDRVNGTISGFRDEMAARFDEMGALERKIDNKLECTISKVLGDEAMEISLGMGVQIAESAKGILLRYGRISLPERTDVRFGADHCPLGYVILVSFL